MKLEGSSAYERVLVSSPTFFNPGWLPPAEECEPLADLRAEHERLLAALKDALSEVSAARRELDAAGDARADALRDAIIAGRDPATVPAADTDEGVLTEALTLYEASCEALEAFVAHAQQQLVERAPLVWAGLDDMTRAAEAKRAEARRLLEEADRLAGQPRRMRAWLDRYTGGSVLGPIAFDTLDVAVPEPVPEMFQQIARLTPDDIIEVGSDELTAEELDAINA